ncbi:hypothetical protein OSB04_021079 [Centaurea solstitialis]|uniref:Trehalose-6-phosphate synthase n=1 Tax=Centaurea solstitialis TaxID=347529 RepID=A0AA38T6Y7_9ASTR|nr:hypothetical protein OSB04_021079 [Centaurea solstitialis]
MTVPGILSEFDEDDNNNTTVGNTNARFQNEPHNRNHSPSERRIIVSNQLPIKSHRDNETNKWAFEYDPDALVLQLKSGFGPDVEAVYVGSLSADIDASEQEEVAQILLEKFRCVPTFLSLEIQNRFYHGFCKHYLWPLFHYMLPVTLTHGVRFDRVAWQAYVSANKVFADKVMEVINPDEDYVWIHDYHLMVMPTFLRKRFHRVRVGFFLHSPFPSSEIYRTLPVRDEILRALLNCDLIGFHTFDYARHFLSCCSRMFGLDYKSKRGISGSIITVEREDCDLGVDDMDMFKGISLKFLAMGQLLEDYPGLRGLVVLVQIVNPARSRGHDIQEVERETRRVAREVNERFGSSGYSPIVFVNGPVSTQDKVAYYAISECVVVNAVRDGMNLVPYKYTVSRQGSPELDTALGSMGPKIGRAMSLAITMPDNEKKLRHEKHYKYVSSHDVAYWARSFDQDLERAFEHIVSAYKKTNSRLILLDYDGTVMPQASVDKTPSKEVLSILNVLSNDPKNVVFIVSGRGTDSLSKWFDSCKNLGLSAEHGWLTRWSSDSRWESCGGSAEDADWKKMALPVMEHYTEATDGSSIEQKESALVWHHQEADPDFGMWQAKELLDHLERREQRGGGGKSDCEYAKQGKPLDFVLCIGDDRSDEDMFEKIASSVANLSLEGTAEVFACTVGQKPSMAKYYLDDTVDVIKMLHGLEAVSSQVPKTTGLGVSFETSA